MKKQLVGDLEFNTHHKNLIVAETFYSLQGEGPTSGTPAVFLRLGGCNLLCKGKGWICDSIEVWKRGSAVHFSQVLDAIMIQRLKDGAHLIITGGEPMLHQEAIVHFLYYLQVAQSLTPFVEVETNGTIVPLEAMIRMVDRWNVSFKLASTGEPMFKRIRMESLTALNKLRTTFKIVISEHAEDDFDELSSIMERYNLDWNKVMLMPAGETQVKLNALRRTVAEMARDRGVKYCDRLHIQIWNQKTGV